MNKEDTNSVFLLAPGQVELKNKGQATLQVSFTAAHPGALHHLPSLPFHS